MKSILNLVALFLCCAGAAQTNLLDSSTWTVGNGSAPGFNQNGTTAENEREFGIGPHGDNVLLWKCIPDAVSNADGGWYTNYFTIDPSKKYRYTVWVKRTNSHDGRTYFGLNTRDASNNEATLKLDGTLRNNPYFWWGDLPELDKWYLMVGFIHESSYSGTTPMGGIYDVTTGQKVLDPIFEFKFASTANTMRHRAYFFYDTNTADRNFFWDPTIYEVNGQEPSLSELLNPGGNSGGGETVWNTNGDDINYIDGNVGIGTASPDEALTVKGKIHAEEVRVDLSVPGPDYVFKEDYPLLSLQEIKEYIDRYGHLPNIPSAADMKTNGVELGTMEMKLLEKIEELTLHLIQQQEVQASLEQRIKVLENRE